MIPHARSAEHYARVEREKRPGERWIEAYRRVAFEDAIAATSTHAEAADLLGLSRPAFSAQLERWGMRPTRDDVREAREDEPSRLRDQAVSMGMVSVNEEASAAKRRADGHVKRALTLMSNNPLMRVNEEAS